MMQYATLWFATDVLPHRQVVACATTDVGCTVPVVDNLRAYDSPVSR